MNCAREITENLYWVGADDRRIALFENIYPVPKGVSYNSYLLLDEKTVLLDTVDRNASEQFLENVDAVLGDRKLDYLIVTHMEPDHCATMQEVIVHHPEVKIVCNAKTVTMIKQFFDFDIDKRAVLVKEGDTFESGTHTFHFVMAPMVHWPEVMIAYESTKGILFSADAFGAFGAIDGNLFADEVNYESDWMDETRRYYTNIVGKYGMQVQAVLKKAAGLDIRMICPLHGLIWRKDLNMILDKYQKWSTYTPEENSVMIAYASIYGHTEQAADVLAAELSKNGVKNIAVYDVSATDPSYIISDAFRYSHVVFASVTYNNGIFPKMETLLHEFVAHNLQNRTIALIQNGTWAPTAAKQMMEILSGLKKNTMMEQQVTLKSAMKAEQHEEIQNLAKAIAQSLA
ncbi:FprA family A-type flavoprotein [Lachnoclostridium sp. An181]|uniref:FprA family A-type flavoprotein n=1 Tax=Lachnoclostridium sp. An181 TaxID=1965575 RepID=UPI000B3ABA7C|nr:FprA family A-type flavoprotein [Lachnoclostridium sp. An181]OUP49229.1 flavodoxin [Lachnoclostridium sp. An181]